MLRLHLGFWGFSINSPFSKGFPKTECFPVLQIEFLVFHLNAALYFDKTILGLIVLFVSFLHGLK